MRPTRPLTGLVAAVHTPFRPDGSLHLDVVEAQDLMAYQLCLRAGDGAFDVPYGVDEWLLAALALGARGAVGSTYNFAAPLYRRMLRAFAGSDLVTAREEQLRSVRLVRLESLGFFDWIRP